MTALGWREEHRPQAAVAWLDTRVATCRREPGEHSPGPKRASVRTPAQGRLTCLGATVLFIVGGVLLLGGLLDAIPIVNLGTEEEQRVREGGLVRLTLGGVLLLLLGLVLLWMRGRLVGGAVVVLAVVAPLLVWVPSIWGWWLTLLLALIALAGWVWMLFRGRETGE